MQGTCQWQHKLELQQQLLFGTYWLTIQYGLSRMTAETGHADHARMAGRT